MAVTDLTNTTWQFNDSVQIYSTTMQNRSYYINFSCDNVTYTDIQGSWWFNPDNNQLSTSLLKGLPRPEPVSMGEHWLGYGGNAVLSGTLSDTGPAFVWVSDAYRTITITGGNDVTNQNLIDWLYENATLQS